MKKLIGRILLFISFAITSDVAGQDSLLDLVGEEETTDFTTASFKTTRVVNLHSVETTAGGVLDFRVNHRFGVLNGGISELFGLDDASIRVGFDYGLSDRFNIGLGRSSFEKTYDGFLKYKVIRQSTGVKNVPFTLTALATTAIETTRFPNPDRENKFSSRLFHSAQIIIGRKFSENLTLQVSPTIVHRNLVGFPTESNDVFSLGLAGRFKLSKRVSVNTEYIYVLPDQLAPGFNNSFTLGFDIETGGHVFQLHFTNSTSMVEKGFISENIGTWGNGDIHFGFNISRVFTLKERK